MLTLYVDDMLIAGHSKKDIVDTFSQFDMKDLGDASHLLGMHIVQNRDKKVFSFLNQSTLARCLSVLIWRRERH